MTGKFRKLVYVLSHTVARPFFGFIEGHGYLAPAQLSQIRSLVGVVRADMVAQFETAFAALIGVDGEVVSFAAARMAFFATMRALGIGKGDEVILPGATCAVMVNAILRTGATPVFADVDPSTFGSSPDGIRARITPRTKLIVAQHSFGIPCDILPIATMAREAGIFLLEDCALTIGSTVGGVAVGNFGNAALFSVDRTKPINAMTGGLVFTRDKALAGRVREIQVDADELPLWKQQALWRRLLRERRFCAPAHNGSLALRDIVARLVTPWAKRPFLDQDFGTAPGGQYPYPARMPAFLAALGIQELRRWDETALKRKALLRTLLGVMDGSGAGARLPAVYRNPDIDIVPLRLAWAQKKAAAMRAALAPVVDVSWTWFMEPIVGTRAPYEAYGYHEGDCPMAETIGPDMVNLPCNVAGDAAPLAEALRRALAR